MNIEEMHVGYYQDTWDTGRMRAYPGTEDCRYHFWFHGQSVVDLRKHSSKGACVS